MGDKTFSPFDVQKRRDFFVVLLSDANQSTFLLTLFFMISSLPDSLRHRPGNAKNAFARRPFKLSSVHRLRLTHGEQPAGPKLIRESTEQFFANATANVSTGNTTNVKRKSVVRPIFSRDSRVSRRDQHDERHRRSSRLNNQQQAEHQFDSFETNRTTSEERRSPMAVLPPIERLKSNKTVRSPSEELILPPIDSVSTPSLYVSSSRLDTSIEESPFITTAATTSIAITPDPRQRSTRPKKQNQFLDAYERALAIARARRSFYDPDRLLGPSPTRHILYSYYDHTPACVFTRGSACGHYGQKSIDYDRRSVSELARRRIYDEIVVDIRR